MTNNDEPEYREASEIWTNYLKETGQTIRDGLTIQKLIADIEKKSEKLNLSKVDKLSIVNLLPITKGELFLILGDRGQNADGEALI
jgi:hypothetical protein